MAEKKKQHYVPQFYLKLFSCNSKFYLYNVESKENIGLYSYKDQCYKTYFYGKDKIWENKLQNLEGKWSKVFLDVLKDDYDNIDLLREFAIFQYARTECFKSRLTETTSLQLKELLKSQLAHDGENISDEIIKEVTDKKARELINPSNNLDMIEELKSLISDLSFLKVHYNTNKKIISCDNPVLMINPYLPPHVGLNMIGLIILFPMSPSDLGVFYDGKVYSKYKKQNVLISNNQSEVNHINSLIYANSDEIVFSINPFDNVFLCESNAKLRVKNKLHSNVQTVGPENNKLVVTQQPTIYHSFNFSFAKINFEFSQINGDYRDSVPRRFDEGFRKKLYDRYQEWFVNMAWKGFDVDKEKYRKGYEDYYHLMTKYWEN